MKKELLEYIIRQCVNEVLNATLPEQDTVGAPAPPAGGQGTADQPALPQDQSANPLLIPGTRGIWFVDPKHPEKPTQIKLSTPQDPAKLERELYRIAAKSGGPRVKVSGAALKEIPRVLSNPNLASFLYIGKQVPEDTEFSLLPAKTYQQAKIGSVTPEPNAEPPIPSQPSPPPQQTPAKPDQPVGRTTAPDIDEGSALRNMISSMIKESIKNSRR